MRRFEFHHFLLKFSYYFDSNGIFILEMTQLCKHSNQNTSFYNDQIIIPNVLNDVRTRCRYFPTKSLHATEPDILSFDRSINSRVLGTVTLLCMFSVI